MSRRYLNAIFALITLTSVLVGFTRQSHAELGTCRLSVEFQPQQNGNWCWVATVSMVLQWHDLRNVEQCHLYDLAHNATSCADKERFPTEWQENNNLLGSPEKATVAYISDNPDKITYEVDRQPFPSFEELANEICPSDGSRGKPFIWAFDGGRANHDVVVYGYNDIGTDQLIDYHDPNSNPAQVLLDPDYNSVSFDIYAEGPPPFKQNFFIRKK